MKVLDTHRCVEYIDIEYDNIALKFYHFKLHKRSSDIVRIDESITSFIYHCRGRYRHHRQHHHRHYYYYYYYDPLKFYHFKLHKRSSDVVRIAGSITSFKYHCRGLHRHRRHYRYRYYCYHYYSYYYYYDPPPHIYTRGAPCANFSRLNYLKSRKILKNNH